MNDPLMRSVASPVLLALIVGESQIVSTSQYRRRRKFGTRLFRSDSGFAWEMERVGGPEFGHVTQSLARLFFVDACVF